jgi:peptidoglycan-associated lipoprotein
MRRVRFLRFASTLILMFSSLALFSCKHPTAAPPAAAFVRPLPTPPPPPAPAPTLTLAAAPATIERGQSTTLTWTASNAATVSITPDLGQVASTGNRQVTPQSSVTYTASANGPGGTASAVARVTVNLPPPPPVAAAPRATPAPRGPDPAAAPPVRTLFDQTMLPVYFDFDKAEIKPSESGRLTAIVAWLKQYPNVKFTIGGHADDRGSQEYNLALGDRRANAVRAYLVSNGIAESRIAVTSFGEERPVCREHTEECWSKNRRGAFEMN